MNEKKINLKIDNTSLKIVKKSKKERCFFKICNKKIHLISYECKYCNKKFCNNHILPEVHECEEIKNIKNIEVTKLEKKLNSERTNNQKIIKIL